jgi:CHAD domain-containing protein
MKTPGDLLACSAARGAARVALGRLAAAQAAAARLARPDDDEALHDFRVALRRLRSALRLYRAELGKYVSVRLRRRVKKLARATNAARDAEVQIAWLRQARLRLTPAERRARNWWEIRLAARRDRSYESVRGRTLAAFFATAPLLERALKPVAASAADKDYGGFARVTGERLQATAQTLREALAKIQTVTDTTEIHAARIAGKRLRYLLEPVASEIPGGSAAVRKMKRFQDEFGLLNDAFVRMAEIEDAAQAAGAEQARVALHGALAARSRARATDDPVRGLVAIARSVQRETGRRFRAVARDYLGSSGGRFVLSLTRLGARLARDHQSLLDKELAS